MSPDEPPRESLSKYLAFAHAHPDLFKNPAHGGFSIVLDKREIREVEARTAELLGSSQGSADWPHVGIAFEDPYLILLRDAVRFPSGSLGTYIRTISPHPERLGVAILPVYDRAVLLVRHFRHATRNWHLEIPRGFGAGSGKEENARRELSEEIGAVASRLFDLGISYPNTGISSEHVALFYADVSVYGQGEAEEAIAEIVPTPMSHLERMIRDCEITDGFTLAAYARAKVKGLL